MSITKYLDDLENRIDINEENRLYADWKRFASGEHPGGFFRPQRLNNAVLSQIEWPDININDALGDYEKMAIRELAVCNDNLIRGSGLLMNVRCNYGPGILASVFGAEIYVMPRKTNTLPTAKSLPDASKTMNDRLNKEPPSHSAGYGKRVFEMCEYFKEIFKPYPKISEYVHIYHPDLQGPFDNCELLFGSDVFFYLHDEPDLIKHSLKLITDTYIRFIDKWFSVAPPPEDGFSVHWGWLHRGSIMLRSDSSMNISPDMYKEFVFEHDNRLLKKFGGAMHFCGRGDHYLPIMCQADGLYAFNISQPHLNDMDVVLANTTGKNLKLIALDEDTAKKLFFDREEEKISVHISQ